MRPQQGFFLKAKSQVNNTFNSSELADVGVILPPLSEQKGIAKALDTVEQTIAHTSTLIAKLKQMKAGLLHDLLTRGLDENGKLRDAIEHPEQFKDSPLGQIPKDWNCTNLGEVGTWLSGGTPSKRVPNYWNGGIPWISPKDMKTFRLIDSIDKITEIGADSGTQVVPSGTIFIVVRGMILAHSFPVGITQKEMAFNQDIKAIVCNEHIAPLYLGYWLVANLHCLLGLVTESTHGTKRIELKDLLNLPIALPPQHEQKITTEILETYDNRIQHEESYLAKLKEQKKGLMHDLLTGRVRVTDLKEIPA